MKLNKVRKQQTVLCATNNEMYYVLNAVKDENEDVVSAIACPTNSRSFVDNEWTGRDDECILINDKNAFCFTLISDPNPADIPEGYEVKDGILYKNEKSVTEQGKIYIEKILTAQPGYLILAVRAENDAESVVFVAYDIENDYFHYSDCNISKESLKNIKIMHLQDDRKISLIYAASIKDIEIPAKDGDSNPVTKQVLVDSYIFRVFGKSIYSYMFVPFFAKNITKILTYDSHQVLSFTIDSVIVEEGFVEALDRPCGAWLDITGGAVSPFDDIIRRFDNSLVIDATYSYSQQDSVVFGENIFSVNDRLFETKYVQDLLAAKTLNLVKLNIDRDNIRTDFYFANTDCSRIIKLSKQGTRDHRGALWSMENIA